MPLILNGKQLQTLGLVSAELGSPMMWVYQQPELLVLAQLRQRQEHPYMLLVT